jgi:chromosome segregation ATPase
MDSEPDPIVRENGVLYERIQELEQLYASLERECAQAKATAALAASQAHHLTRKLTTHTSDADNENENAQARIEEEVREKQALEEARARIEDEVREKQAMEEELRKKVTDLEQENEYFQGELIDSKMKLAELTAKHEEMSAQNKRPERSLNELKAKEASAPPAKDGKKK